MTEIKRLNPKQSWEFIRNTPQAVLIDVRTAMEFFYVGHPVGCIHISWKEIPDWSVNKSFVDQVVSKIPDLESPMLLMCRSGQRSMEAAKALAEFGYKNLINVEEGFEGGLDENKHRGTLGGWRFHGLRWEQG